MTIEVKIFLTCIIFMILASSFVGAAKKSNVPLLIKLTVVATFFLSAAGAVGAILFAIWR
jgi:hypothetical protein